VQNFALCSVVNDLFAAGYIIMIDSFRRANPDLDPALYVIAGDGSDFLSAGARALIEKNCGPVTFLEVDAEDYLQVYEMAHTHFKTPPKLLPAFYLFEAFYRPKERYVLCLDSDLLILGSFQEILSCPARLAAVRARNAFTGLPETYVNTGVLWLDRTRLGDMTRPQALMEQIGSAKPEKGTGLADQAVLNILWAEQTMFYLPSIFNYTKRSLVFDMLKHNEAAAEAYRQHQQIAAPEAFSALAEALDIRALHYVGQKPWDMKTSPREQAFAPVEELWWQALERQGDPETMAWALKQMTRT